MNSCMAFRNTGLATLAGTLAVALLAGALSGSGCGRYRPTELSAPEVVTDSLLTKDGDDQLRLIRFLDPEGTEHEGWLRRVEWPAGEHPGSPRPPMQSVVVLGGIGTAQRAAEIVPCPPGVSVLALDYAYDESRQPTHSNIIANVPQIREAADVTPRGINAALGKDAIWVPRGCVRWRSISGEPIFPTWPATG
jgi:hypothetical protein